MKDNFNDEFFLKGENGHLHLKIMNVYNFPDKTCYWGGYDTNSIIEINSSNYSVRGYVSISTGEIYNFYVKFKDCYEKLAGEAYLRSYEQNLELKVVFDGFGHAKIQGRFKENHSLNNILEFTILTDQTYLKQTLISLEAIHDKFGDDLGIPKK
jgi:hypothetical protein